MGFPYAVKPSRLAVAVKIREDPDAVCSLDTLLPESHVFLGEGVGILMLSIPVEGPLSHVEIQR